MQKEYNQKEVEEKFQAGKTLLDRGEFHRALPIFTELIDFCEPYKDDEDAELTIHVSLNNRGVCKCNMALYTHNIDLYKDGLSDYKKAFSEYYKNEDKGGLVAHNNFVRGSKELERFDEHNHTGTNFKNPYI